MEGFATDNENVACEPYTTKGTIITDRLATPDLRLLGRVRRINHRKSFFVNYPTGR